MQRVLVCEDERHIGNLISSLLQRQGYEVVYVLDGRKAIEELEASTFDKAILDLMVPYLDGFEILKWIRTHERTSGMWVALMTANARELEADTIQPYRADLYVPKPVDYECFPKL